ncbi:MAG TPA: hypothetical protein PK198_04565 [Saprospiraceae bacterium]|nr:hypothetical protein [Saprospiraceae bacterium]
MVFTGRFGAYKSLVGTEKNAVHLSSKWPFKAAIVTETAGMSAFDQRVKLGGCGRYQAANFANLPSGEFGRL